MKDVVVDLLQKRGVGLNQIARIVFELQVPYQKDLTLEECFCNVGKVIEKREVQHIILTGAALDIMAEQGKMSQPLQKIIADDEPLYGVDESLGMAIATIYGTIGATSFGFLDKSKPGIMAELDKHNDGRVNTFLDDIVAGIASAAAARLAHAGKRKIS